jgi:hypothetical protein
MAKPLPKKQRSRRRNGQIVLDGRSAKGRRIRELTEAYSMGLPLDDETARGLVASTARLQIEIETLEDKIDRKQPVDHDVYTKLINTRERGLERLREMRTQARPSTEPATGGAAALAALQRHIHYLIWARPHKASYAKGVNDPDLIALYEREEAAGAFRDVAR